MIVNVGVILLSVHLLQKGGNYSQFISGTYGFDKAGNYDETF